MGYKGGTGKGYYDLMRRFLFNSPGLLARRKELRNKPTNAEKVLWRKLRKYQLKVKFRRQFSIGNYILDFYCPGKKLGIEVEGKIHLRRKDQDLYRLRTLEKELGIKLLRYRNEEVERDLSRVIDLIGEELEKR